MLHIMFMFDCSFVQSANDRLHNGAIKHKEKAIIGQNSANVPEHTTHARLTFLIQMKGSARVHVWSVIIEIVNFLRYKYQNFLLFADPRTLINER